MTDNQGAKALAKDNAYHARTKHIDVQYHFVCEVVEAKNITIIYMPTEDMLADIFTKPLACAKFDKFCTMLGLRSALGGVSMQ